jgi:hypothetical protein
MNSYWAGYIWGLFESQENNLYIEFNPEERVEYDAGFQDGVIDKCKLQEAIRKDKEAN